MKAVVLLLVLFIAFGCSDNKQKKQATTVEHESVIPSKEIPHEESNIEDSSDEYHDYSNTELSFEFMDSTSHYFSNDSLKDHFVFYIPKGKITKTESYLKITNAKGDLLYEERFPTFYFIYGYGTNLIKNDSQIIEHIIERVKGNLEANKFIDLENTDDSILEQSIPEDFNNYEAYLECKENNRLLYVFSLENESITYLGYSAKLNKVVPIRYCC